MSTDGMPDAGCCDRSSGDAGDADARDCSDGSEFSAALPTLPLYWATVGLAETGVVALPRLL